ncbi:MAG: Hsp20 family protein [Treponema sp.]|jgi:HSP20 family molecular chaperone IbpA|nr:Hsp20 family protein [Treponema sp.]
MKGARDYMDVSTIFDEIFEAAHQFRDEMHRNFDCGPHGQFYSKGPFDERVDVYPNYTFPPMNVYMTNDRSLIFEFALAGFDEKDIGLSFQGDYMIFSAKVDEEQARESGEESIRYLKRRLKLKDIEKQKYFVPLDKYAQERVKAVYKNGILKVSIPTKDDLDQNDGVKIEIIKEGI